MHGRLAILTLVVALAAAGCVKTADTQEPAEAASVSLAERPALVAPEWLAQIELGTVAGGAEPSIAVAPDGAVYVTTPLALWRSDDGGATYEWLGSPYCATPVVGSLPVDPPACPIEERDAGMQGGGDADLAITPDGRLHWLGLVAQDAPIPYQFSDDRGATWSDVEDLADGNSSDREWIHVRQEDGAIFATWRDFGNEQSAESGIQFRASFDNGATWTPGVKAEDDNRMGGAVPDPRASSRALYLPSDDSGTIRVARSLDDGATWESIEAAKFGNVRGHIFPVAAVDAAGTVYVVFAMDEEKVTPVPNVVGETDRSLQHPNVYLIVSKDQGATWTEPLRLNPEGTTAIFPWIAAGAPGRVVVAWYENADGTSLQEIGHWWTASAVSVTADQDAPAFEHAIVSTTEARVGTVCSNGGACGATAGDRSLLDFFEVAIGLDGLPVITWAGDADLPRAAIRVFASKVTAGTPLVDVPAVG